VTEAITKRGSTSFYLSKDTFDSIPISVANRLKSESCSSQCSGEVLCVIDEKHGIFNVVFLTKLSQKLF